MRKISDKAIVARCQNNLAFVLKNMGRGKKSICPSPETAWSGASKYAKFRQSPARLGRGAARRVKAIGGVTGNFRVLSGFFG